MHFVATILVAAAVILISDRDNILGQFLDPLTRITAWMTVSILNGLGTDCLRDGLVVYKPEGFAYEVYYRCTGFLSIYVLSVAVFASRGRFKDKVIGLVVGIPVLLVINLVRLVSLFLIGVAKPDYVEFVHDFVWQGVILVVVFLLC